MVEKLTNLRLSILAWGPGLSLVGLAGLLNTYSQNNMIILIVEDEDKRAKELQSFLQTKLTKVIRARDGYEALIILKKHKPDLILSDINMPSMDGYRLVKRVKEDEKTKAIPVFIYSSSRISDDNKELAMELGADHCLDNTEVDGIGSEALTIFATL